MIPFKDRLPQRREIQYVFGGVVFIIYSWAIRGFIYQLSSLRLYHTLGEILAVFSYLMAFALVESLIMTGSLVLLGFLMPGKWLREGFAYKGFLTTFVAGIAMIWLHYYLSAFDQVLPPWNALFLGTGIAIALLIFLLWVFHKMPRLRTLLLSFQERLQIFIFLYVPLGLLGFTIVVFRNLR